MKILLLLLLVSLPTLTWPQVRIIDGDTIEIGEISYRLNGIDAPEVGQKCPKPSGTWNCGDQAIKELASLAEDRVVECVAHSQDGYGRTLATCYVDGRDIGAVMVSSGYAWAFVKYSHAYISEEAQAKSEHLGVWQGDAMPPWEYRAEKWANAEQEAPEGCPIKGNISGNGRIYHPPWSPWYSRTRINEAKGEKWFCSEAEAVAAGWRAPHWR